MNNHGPITVKLTYSYKEAGAVLGKCPRTIQTMVKLGRIQTVKPCRRREIPASEIERLKGQL